MTDLLDKIYEYGGFCGILLFGMITMVLPAMALAYILSEITK